MNTFAFIQKFKTALPLIIALLCLTTLTAFSQKPELYVQTGHSLDVTSVAFSPDGKTLASGSSDNTIKLWDVASGQELKTLKGHSLPVQSVAFSPDGQTLASGSWDNTIKLWDVVSGQELKTLKGYSKVSASIAFSPDGGALASGSSDNTIKLWIVASGQELQTLKGHSLPVTSVAFSSDGKTLASGSLDNTIKLWDVASGQELKTLKHSLPVWTIAFSPDSRTLASGSGLKEIKLWDVASGQELKTLKGHSGFVRSVAFSSDGETLASGSDDYTIKLWDVASGQELKTLKGHSLKVWTIAFSPDCKMLASGSHDKTLKVWDVASGQELKTLKEHSLPVTTVAFSPDGKTLASGSWRNAIKLWDVVSGHELKSVKGNSNPVQSVAFSPDGKTLASGGDDNTINLWDVTSGQELKILKGHSLYVNSIAFSPDGKTLASGSLDKTIKLWDVASGQELQTLKGHSLPVWTIAFSPDGKTLASGSLDNTIKLWDLASGQELKTLKHSPRVWTMAFSPDGKTLASGSMDSTIKLWNVASGQELKTLKGHSLYVNSIAFSPDGKTLASGSYDNTIKLWNMASGQELKTLKGHSGVVVSVTFSPDGKTLASGGFDSTIKLWEVSSGNNLASLIALDETDWAVVTPDGLFDGSPNAWKQLIWRLDNNTFKYASVEAFFKEFYYPGLLQEIMEGKRPRPPVKNLSEVDIRQPGVSIRRVGGQPVQERGLGQPVTLTNAVLKRNVEVEIQVTDNNSPPSRPSHPATNVAQDLRLFRNGSLVKLWRGVLFDKQSGCDQIASKLRAPARAVCKVTIPLVAGDNNLTAYAFNHENIKSNDGEALVKGAESLRRAGTLYTLAIGVNEYANSQYNLKYAAADAQGFAGELKRQQAKLKNYERVELISLIDKDATKTNILKSLADLSAKIQPEDALVIYFAGHGTAQQNRFYLIPHDLGYAGSRTQLNDASLKNILAHSISDEELEAAVEGIDAGQMLLVIDACNSGQALEAEEKRRGPMNSKGLAQLAYEKGMYILTAAQSYQAAKEAAKLGHGFLTYALVEEGLKTPVADREPKDGQVLLREWLDFATERVPQMQQDEIKKRQLVQEKSGAAVRPNDDNLQRPRVFYRRETEPHPLVVARP